MNKSVIRKMDPLTDDYAVQAPLPVRIDNPDPYLKPNSPVRGVVYGVLLGIVAWGIGYLVWKLATLTVQWFGG